MTYFIRTKVRNLEHKRRAKSARQVPDESDPNKKTVVWAYEDIGWFVTFENSHESLFIGMHEPTDLKIGQEVMIAIRPI